MLGSPFSQSQVDQFNRDGYFIVRALFDREEMEIVRTRAKADQALQSKALDYKDAAGLNSKITLWDKAGDDALGLITRSHRVVDRCEQLLGDSVYHYHSKMTMKEPFTGGAWEWHQDYGYWYGNGYLFPDLISCFTAVDANTRENGCMQVIKGSHRLGRVEHGRFGEQVGADPERVEEALKVLSLEYAVLEPGDSLFFHSNTLHRSDANRSPNPRWSFICCYTTSHNLPYRTSTYMPEAINKAADDELRKLGTAHLASAK